MCPYLRPIPKGLHPFNRHQGERQCASRDVAVNETRCHESVSFFPNTFVLSIFPKQACTDKGGGRGLKAKLSSVLYIQRPFPVMATILHYWVLHGSVSLKTLRSGAWGRTYISSGTALQTHSESQGGNQAVSQSCLNLKNCHCLVLVQASPPFPTADEALYCCIRGVRKALVMQFRFLFLNSDFIPTQCSANNWSIRTLNSERRASMTVHDTSNGSLWNTYHLI